ncbi:hypothetical protein CC80DRAFT_589099 [Byssothecium circinans]|uniref:Uncharacterized protein n=1 Tax=Byssothecium circinans TaxID=147558 RepID=A0A6A5UF95_9PLEO|nr:hypothetical protein CC80DRAFT_589099 [Byssothecium circinans]
MATHPRCCAGLEHDNSDGWHDIHVAYVKALCSRAVAAPHARKWSLAKICDQASREDGLDDERFEGDLLAAAVYMNHLSLVVELVGKEGILRQRYSPTEFGLFGSPYLNAIATDNEAALELHFEAVEASPNLNLNKVRHSLIRSACHYGSTRMLKRILPVPDWRIGYRWMGKIEDGMAHSNLPSFEFLKARRTDYRLPATKQEERTVESLIGATLRCREDVVRHLLEMGASLTHIRWRVRHNSAPLLQACRGGFTGIVRILLEHGALILGDEIGEAAQHGRWYTVRVLLEHGVDVNSGSPPVVMSAVAWEREDVFCELVK